MSEHTIVIIWRSFLYSSSVYSCHMFLISSVSVRSLPFLSLIILHWRREWQTTSVFSPWEPHEQYERQKYRTLKDELSWSVGARYTTGDQWRYNSRKNKGMQPKQKQHPVVDGTDDRSKVQCCKEQYCVGTWNVMSTKQGKLGSSQTRWQEWTLTF